MLLLESSANCEELNTSCPNAIYYSLIVASHGVYLIQVYHVEQWSFFLFLTSNKNTNSRTHFSASREAIRWSLVNFFTVLICEQAWFPRKCLHFNRQHLNSNVSLTTKCFGEEMLWRRKIFQVVHVNSATSSSRKSEGPGSDQGRLVSFPLTKL